MKRHISRLLQPGVIWYCFVLVAFSAVSFVFANQIVGISELVLTAVIFVISRIRFIRRKRLLMDYVQTATDSVGISVHAGSPFPMAVITLPENEIIWGNPAFYSITGLNSGVRYQNITSILPDFDAQWLREGRSELPGDHTIASRRYRVYGNYVHSDDEELTVRLAAIYFADMTEVFNIRDEFDKTRPVVSILLIDNYDELTNSLSDSAISKIDAQINDAVTVWLKNAHALCRKIERNRYLILFESRDLQLLQEKKFSILDSVRKITAPSGIMATVSLGIGKDGHGFEESYSFALLAIEMSLSRGGDQVVIKDRLNFSFFGGLAKENERHTKVKARVIANSLSALITQSSQVYIMGHRMADLDALGAAVGLSCLCRKLDKRVKIVLNPTQNAAGSLLSILENSADFRTPFLSEQDAMIEADARTLLIVVDTNRPSQVESKELLESIPRVVVIDHHRRAADYIDDAVLTFHEPFASSASELVAELLQYAVDSKFVRPVEAQAMLAGIALDTKNFTVRTGARTFETAAFLRRAGADPVAVKKLFQSGLDATLSRYRVVQEAKLYRKEIAIAAVSYPITRTIAAQAADELLNISGVFASFVLYPAGDQVVISARSIGNCNVQVILEQLGGGGNGATAGAQIKSEDIETVYGRLTAAIDQFYEA